MSKHNEHLSIFDFLLIEDSKTDALLITHQLSLAFQQPYTLDIVKTLEEGLDRVVKKNIRWCS